MTYIVAVRLIGGVNAEHISEVIWVDSATFESNRCTREVMVNFLVKNPGTVKVTDGTTTSTVEVVKADPPYLRSEKDASKTDNLLALPKF